MDKNEDERLSEIANLHESTFVEGCDLAVRGVANVVVNVQHG